LDFEGGPEWAAIGDTGRGMSLFVLQHHRDDVDDFYSAADGDTARLQFSRDQSPRLPVRYSFGLVDSADAAGISERIDFVRTAEIQ
jgi:hypothetical protein